LRGVKKKKKKGKEELLIPLVYLRKGREKSAIGAS